jgi:hypothetical protein
MTWFKIDDKSTFHKKIVDAGNEAWGAFCRAGAWSSERLTDGRIPWPIANTIASRAVWARAFKAGLCDPIDDGEFQLHDYLHWNPSREEVLRLRTLRSESGRTGGKRRQAKREAPPKPVLKQVPKPTLSNAQANFNPDPDPDPRDRERAHTPRVDPEFVAIRDRIRRWPIFASLNADRLADEQVGWMDSKGQSLPWVLTAVDEAATKIADGATYQEKHSKLVSFMHSARRPREAPPPRKHVESDEPLPTDAELEANRKRMNEKAAALRAERERREKLEGRQ